MRGLDLNLASRPFRNNTLLWVGHALLVGTVIGASAWNTLTFLDTGGRLEELRSRVGSIENRFETVQMQERRLQAEIARHDLKYLAIQTSRANDVIGRRALSWTRLFNLLEKVQPYEVRMVSIRPVFGVHALPGSPAAADLDAGEMVPVSVEGTAKDLNAFLDLERALIADPHFGRVEPERRTHTKSGEVLFGLSFLYDPEGRVAHAPSAAQAAPPEREAPPAAVPPEAALDEAPVEVRDGDQGAEE